MTTRTLHPLLALLLLGMALLLSGNLMADDAPPPFSEKHLQSISETLDATDKSLQDSTISPAQLDSLLTNAISLEQTAQTCISQFGQRQTQTQQSIQSLGVALKEENSEVKSKRKELGEQNQQIEKTLSQCRLVKVRTTTQQDLIRQAKQDILKKELFARAPSLLDYLQGLSATPIALQTDLTNVESALVAVQINGQALYSALGYGLLGLISAGVWSRYKRLHPLQKAPPFQGSSPTFSAVWLGSLKVIPYLLMFGFTALSLFLSPPGVQLFLHWSLTLLTFIFCYATLRALLQTKTPLEGIVPIGDRTKAKLYFWARALLLTLMLVALTHSEVLEQSPLSNMVGLTRILTDTLVGIAMIKLVWLLADHFLLLKSLKLQWFNTMALLVASGSAWLGYQHFADTLFHGVLGTLLILLLTWLALRIPTEVFDGLDEGHTQWQQHIRQQLALHDGQIVPGLLWVRLAHSLIVVSLGCLLLMRLWGMSEQSQWLLLTQVASGIQIAGFNLEPLRIIAGLLVLAGLIGLTHLFKNHLSEKWLGRTSLSLGVQEATTTIFGYIGILFAILLGLSVAGIQLKNLAIIAGALSVGIGFGLQNIVNNFVSGLIILFEHPIRRGDWIKVGSAEGYVKEISIRSTTIQTRERADIIVPNSELISGQVTNMMLDDVYGRLTIPVGVGYGSDTDLVITTLRGLAEAHPNVVKGREDMKVAVYLLKLADSALEFELRCYIYNVDARFAITSDLNIAIVKAFRTLHIEIPYPQRVMHIVADKAVSP